jgi:hypothetical protein
VDKDYNVPGYEATFTGNLLLTFERASCLHIQDSQKIINCWENWSYYKEQIGFRDNCNEPI